MTLVGVQRPGVNQQVMSGEKKTKNKNAECKYECFTTDPVLLFSTILADFCPAGMEDDLWSGQRQAHQEHPFHSVCLLCKREGRTEAGPESTLRKANEPDRVTHNVLCSSNTPTIGGESSTPQQPRYRQPVLCRSDVCYDVQSYLQVRFNQCRCFWP